MPSPVIVILTVPSVICVPAFVSVTVNLMVSSSPTVIFLGVTVTEVSFLRIVILRVPVEFQ